jgi:hypothetical protein
MIASRRTASTGDSSPLGEKVTTRRNLAIVTGSLEPAAAGDGSAAKPLARCHSRDRWPRGLILTCPHAARQHAGVEALQGVSRTGLAGKPKTC